MGRGAHDQLLLGEWACLGVLCATPAHGFAVAKRLAPDGGVGRIWSLSRALTYRCLDQLVQRELVHAVAEEPGIAGGPRTVLAPTRSGRAQFRRWVATPAAHLRDLRSELLLKVVLADECGIDVAAMLRAQRDVVAELALAHDPPADGRLDVVELWRHESSQAALRVLDRLVAERATAPGRSGADRAR